MFGFQAWTSFSLGLYEVIIMFALSFASKLSSFFVVREFELGGGDLAGVSNYGSRHFVDNKHMLDLHQNQ